MSMSRRKRSIVAMAIAGATLGGLSAAPASADCVSAELYYRQSGDSNQYAIGPKKCLVSTPYDVRFEARREATAGPATAGVGVWVAHPPILSQG